jgi:hypothetical protein
MAKQSIDVLGLTPGQDYRISVYAVTTESDGKQYTSQYSTPLTISTPAASANGSNFSLSNNGTDIQLKGGSLYAGTFPTNAGQIDVVNDTPDGSGVILNQTGLAGFNNGTKEFYIDASTGNAYFAGTIGAIAIQSVDYSPSVATVEPKYTVAGMNIDLSDGSISSEKFRIDANGNAYFSGNILGGASINGYPASGVQLKAYTSVQPGNGVGVNGSNQIATIDTGSGVVVTTKGTNFPRIEINSNGLFLYNTGYSDLSVGLYSVSDGTNNAGDAYFKGKVTATSGYIGTSSQGWQIASSNIASKYANLILYSDSGSIVSSGTMTGWYGSTMNVTSTIASGKITVYSDESTIGYADSTVDSALDAHNNTNKTSIYPNGLRIESTATNYGVGVGGLQIHHASGDYDIHFRLYGANDSNGYTQRNILFDHWSVAGQRNANTATAIFDTSLNNGLRPLVVYTDGRAYLGATDYFSTTQTTTPSSSTGLNGDFFYSTA